jgi:hypothetical protein
MMMHGTMNVKTGSVLCEQKNQMFINRMVLDRDTTKAIRAESWLWYEISRLTQWHWGVDFVPSDMDMQSYCSARGTDFLGVLYEAEEVRLNWRSSLSIRQWRSVGPLHCMPYFHETWYSSYVQNAADQVLIFVQIGIEWHFTGSRKKWIATRTWHILCPRLVQCGTQHLHAMLLSCCELFFFVTRRTLPYFQQ